MNPSPHAGRPQEAEASQDEDTHVDMEDNAHEDGNETLTVDYF